MAKSELEEQFLELLDEMVSYHGLALPSPVREFQFHPVRRWRFDFAWPDVKVAVEIEGGTWIGGRHSTGLGQSKDFEKRNAAAAVGWRVLHFTADMLREKHDVFEQLWTAFGGFSDEESFDVWA